jgi:hypothetical protein
MARIKAEVQVNIPDDIARQCSDAQIQEWVRFNLHENGLLLPSAIQDLEFKGVAFTAQFEWIARPLSRAPA